MKRERRKQGHYKLTDREREALLPLLADLQTADANVRQALGFLVRQHQLGRCAFNFETLSFEPAPEQAQADGPPEVPDSGKGKDAKPSK